MTELQQYYDKKASARNALPVASVYTVASLVCLFNGRPAFALGFMGISLYCVALFNAAWYDGRCLTVMEYLGYDSPCPPIDEWMDDLEERGEFVKFD